MLAPRPAQEAARLAALHRYAILDTAPEAAFDDLTRLAAHICGTPIALVSLVDANRQWFKSHLGLEALETPRDIAFCAHGILQADVLVVPDAQTDDRFASSPLVTDDPHIRFYAGAPLVTPDGHAIGMLCVNDHVPRDLSPEQIEALRTLGRLTITQLELRRALTALQHVERDRDAAEAERQQALDLLETTFEALPDGIMVVDAAGQISGVNQQCVDLWRIPQELLSPRDDQQIVAWMQAQLTTPDPLLANVQALDAPPEARSYAVLTLRDGRIIECYTQPQQLVGVLIGHVWSFRDITVRKQLEIERSQLQDELIRIQEARLAELSTPLIPLSEQVVAMPLIGTIDTQRAGQIIDTLLMGITETRAQIAILDITGVKVVDTQVANALVRAAQAGRLLGAQIILTGIRPEVAQTLVELGTDLNGMITRSTLQAGIAYALQRTRTDSNDTRQT